MLFEAAAPWFKGGAAAAAVAQPSKDAELAVQLEVKAKAKTKAKAKAKTDKTDAGGRAAAQLPRFVMLKRSCKVYISYLKTGIIPYTDVLAHMDEYRRDGYEPRPGAAIETVGADMEWHLGIVSSTYRTSQNGKNLRDVDEGVGQRDVLDDGDEFELHANILLPASQRTNKQNVGCDAD